MVNNRDMQSLILYGFNKDIPSLAVNKTGVTSTMPFEEFQKTNHYRLAVALRGKPSWTLLKGTSEFL